MGLCMNEFRSVPFGVNPGTVPYASRSSARYEDYLAKICPRREGKEWTEGRRERRKGEGGEGRSLGSPFQEGLCSLLTHP